MIPTDFDSLQERICFELLIRYDMDEYVVQKNFAYLNLSDDLKETPHTALPLLCLISRKTSEVKLIHLFELIPELKNEEIKT